MALRDQIEDLCKAAVLVDADDLPGLAAVHERLQSVESGFADARYASIQECLAKATRLVEQIVLAEASDPQQSLELVKKAVEFVANSFEAEARGLPLPAPESATATGEVAATSAPGAGGETPDGPVTFPGGGEVENVAEILAESREHIQLAENALLELEKSPTDKELINTVFRSFHTIKSVAGLGNLTPMVSLAHSAEYLLDAARSNKVQISSDNLGVILRSCDQMTQMMRAVEGTGPAPLKSQLAALIGELERATTGEAAPAQVAARTVQQPAPRPAPIPDTPPNAMNAAAELNVTPEAPAPATEVEEGLPSDARVTQRPSAQEPVPAQAEATVTGGTAKRAEQTVKVSTTRMDSLVDLVGELVIAQQMVVQDPVVKGIREPRLNRSLTMVGKIIRDLQEVSMSLRMVPVKATFQKMARLVRDTAAKCGKQIELVTEGDDVELDRNVVEAIADPLVHMIRNACDHGIEMPEVRTASGKSKTGMISLRAFHSGGSILIQISDDGKGLDRNRILGKAIERNIFTLDRPANEVPDHEVYNLIFLPGFSTAEAVTDLSGRGVGMDVVRRNIEALRGKVEIDSTPGQGTTFTMRLPLTLAIIDGMVVRVGQQRYVIPTLSIERSFQPGETEIHTVAGGGGMASVRGGLLPIVRLEQVLQNATRRDERDALLIVVESQEARACFAVDEIIGQQQVVIKSLGRCIQSVRGVSGGAILGDGRVALILDVAGILAQAEAGTSSMNTQKECQTA